MKKQEYQILINKQLKQKDLLIRNKDDNIKQIVGIKVEPKDPKYLPNKPARQESIIDKNTINKYMLNIIKNGKNRI